jgi:hypothetical protein
LRATFSLYRGALGAFAELVESGTAQVPTRVGAFVVKRAEITRTGAICLWLDLNPVGYSGFMRCSPELIERQVTLWSRTSLGGGWYLVEED